MIEKEKFYLILKKLSSWFIGTIGGIILGLFIAGFWDDFLNLFSAEPYLAVVVANETVGFELSKEFRNGWSYALGNKDYFVSKGGKEIKIVYPETNLLEDEALRIANELDKDENCIMVVGNATSTLSNISLDVFLKSDSRISFIMPIATDNNLIEKAKKAKYKNVLRMVPDNSKQADKITDLVFSNYIIDTRKIKPIKVVIYGDQENIMYSVNLSRDIAAKIRTAGASIVVEELLGPLNSFYNSSNILLSDNKPDVIIYVGVSHHGELLLDQLAELNIKIPIVFTDGCLISSLLTQTQKYPGKVFITSPVLLKGVDTMKPTYDIIGKDAKLLVETIFKQIDIPTRENVRKYLENRNEKFEIKGADAGEYLFDKDGNNESMDYKIYEIKSGKRFELIQPKK